MGKPPTVFPGFELFRRLARRHGVPERNAEDIAQEALLRGLEADKRLDPGGDPAPYRVTIAINQARNHVRDARCRGEVLTSFDECEIRDEYPTPEELLRRRQREKFTRELIDQLDPKYRDLVIKQAAAGAAAVEASSRCAAWRPREAPAAVPAALAAVAAGAAERAKTGTRPSALSRYTRS